MKNTEQQAWERFIEKHQFVFNVKSLGDVDPDKYLKNRLWWAFQAGVDAGRESAATHMVAEAKQ